MNVRIVAVFLLSVVIGLACGCSSGLSQEEIATVDFGPLPENYQDLIKRHMADPTKAFHLMDPYSAVYRFEQPYKGKVWNGLLRGGNQYGWVVNAWVNAKNNFGAYVGEQKYEFLIRDGVVFWP